MVKPAGIATIGRPEAVQTLYRYDTTRWDDRIKIVLRTFSVLSETPRGYWFYSQDCRHHGKKFVLKDAKKRYCYPTKEAAMTSFKRRKLMQIKILNRQLSTAKQALAMANSGQESELDNWGVEAALFSDPV